MKINIFKNENIFVTRIKNIPRINIFVPIVHVGRLYPNCYKVHTNKTLNSEINWECS